MSRRKIWILAVLLAIGIAGAGYGLEGLDLANADSEASRGKPNIVYIHTDDLSYNLIQYMSAVRAMRRDGTTFRNHFVADGLCCPSRAAMLTGRFPHNTRVLTNKSGLGGNQAFVDHGNQKRTYAVALDKAGYRTGLLGKYLNGYHIDSKVPPGWDEWHVGGAGAYSNMGGRYKITDVRHKGDGHHVSSPKSYLNDLLGARARDLISRARSHHQPFYLQLSSFAPHSAVDEDFDGPRFPPALRDRPGGEFEHGDCGVVNGRRTDCRSLKVKRGTGFGRKVYRELDTDLRNRVRMVQSLNDQIIRIRRHLTRTELAKTYFVFSSDNGFHLGDHGLKRGKGSAYDHDARTPLVVTGPGVKRGRTRDEIVQNIDVYATLMRIAGVKPRATDGHSLKGLLEGDSGKGWRDAALLEHHGLTSGREFDPDDEGDEAAATRARFNPGAHTYTALRTGNWLYVSYANGRKELYDLRHDPGQNHNVYDGHRAFVRTTLAPRMKALHGCDLAGCWKAGHM